MNCAFPTLEGCDYNTASDLASACFVDHDEEAIRRKSRNGFFWRQDGMLQKVERRPSYRDGGGDDDGCDHHTIGDTTIGDTARSILCDARSQLGHSRSHSSSDGGIVRKFVGAAYVREADSFLEPGRANADDDVVADEDTTVALSAFVSSDYAFRESRRTADRFGGETPVAAEASGRPRSNRSCDSEETGSLVSYRTEWTNATAATATPNGTKQGEFFRWQSSTTPNEQEHLQRLHEEFQQHKKSYQQQLQQRQQYEEQQYEHQHAQPKRQPHQHQHQQYEDRRWQKQRQQQQQQYEEQHYPSDQYHHHHHQQQQQQQQHQHYDQENTPRGPASPTDSVGAVRPTRGGRSANTEADDKKSHYSAFDYIRAVQRQFTQPYKDPPSDKSMATSDSIRAEDAGSALYKKGYLPQKKYENELVKQIVKRRHLALIQAGEEP